MDKIIVATGTCDSFACSHTLYESYVKLSSLFKTRIPEMELCPSRLPDQSSRGETSTLCHVAIINWWYQESEQKYDLIIAARIQQSRTLTI